METGADIKHKDFFQKNNLKCIEVSEFTNTVDGAVVGALEQNAGAYIESNTFVLEQNNLTDKFTCKFCFKEFLYNRNLNKHIKE